MSQEIWKCSCLHRGAGPRLFHADEREDLALVARSAPMHAGKPAKNRSRHFVRVWMR